MPAAFRATLAVLCVSFVFAAPGCGNSSTPKAAKEQPAAAANEEEKVEAPVQKPPAKVEKKPEVKPAPAPVAHRRPEDPTKWDLADLQSGLTAQDARFVPAAVNYSKQHPNGAKEAQDLRGLLERVGTMKDDPSITLPLAPAPVAAPVTAAKPVTPAPATAPANTAPAAKGMRRPGGGFGRIGGQKSAE
jgi:hypothetical protein